MAKQNMDKEKSALAMTSLILGILSLLLGWFPIIGWIIIFSSVIVGIMGYFETKKKAGRNLVMVGLLLTAISVFIMMMLFLAILSLSLV